MVRATWRRRIVQHVISNVRIVEVKVADLKIRLPTLLFIFAPGMVTDTLFYHPLAQMRWAETKSLPVLNTRTLR